MFRERTILHGQRIKASNPLGEHDERIRAVLLRQGGGTAVRNITVPFSGERIPCNNRPGTVEGLALRVHRRPVIDNPAIHRPTPGPAGEEPESVLVVLRIPPCHHVPFTRIRTGVYPATSGCGAVVLEQDKRRDLVALLEGKGLSAVLYLRIPCEVAVYLLCNLVDVRLVSLAVVPCKLGDRFGCFPSFVQVEFLQPFMKLVDYPEIAFGLAWGLHRLVTPLRPAPGVDDAPFFLHGTCRREQEYFRPDGSRVYAGTFPERRGLRLPEINRYQPLQLS